MWAAMLMDANECNLLEYELRTYRAMKQPFLQGYPELQKIGHELDALGRTVLTGKST